MMQKILLEVKKKAEKKLRKCMFDNCSDQAIKSHVLQKNGILREISENNHLIQLVSANPFEMHEKGISDFKLVGINDVYTFKGFCSEHDSEVFKSIESETEIDFQNKAQQALFCYRGLCQEIRRKEIANEWIVDLKPHFPYQYLPLVTSMSDGFIDGISNLTFFKMELEKCIISCNYNQFIFETIKIPKIDLCVSVPLNIGNLEIPKDNDYEKWRNENKIVPTSFINLFPKENENYVIIGYHKDYPCNWTSNFIEIMKAGNRKEIFKEISDLLTLRLEFWTMSKSLFEKIPQIKIAEYKFLFSQNVFDHSPELKTDLNFFENI